jgi:hypothetical protein
MMARQKIKAKKMIFVLRIKQKYTIFVQSIKQNGRYGQEYFEDGTRRQHG